MRRPYHSDETQNCCPDVWSIASGLLEADTNEYKRLTFSFFGDFYFI